MPWQGGPAAAGEEPEAVGEALRDVGQRQGAQARRREFDRERETVQAAHDVDHRRDVRVVDTEVGTRRGGAIGEQAHGWIGESIRCRCVCSGLAERRYGEDDLADDAQRLAAGREHA